MITDTRNHLTKYENSTIEYKSLMRMSVSHSFETFLVFYLKKMI